MRDDFAKPFQTICWHFEICNLVLWVFPWLQGGGKTLGTRLYPNVAVSVCTAPLPLKKIEEKEVLLPNFFSFSYSGASLWDD